MVEKNKNSMIYVCSDIHAEYDLFIKLLEKINFSNADTMYIAGDVIDKGKDSVRLMQFVMSKPNIHTIIGNHEHDFLKYYWSLMQQTVENFDNVLKKLQTFFPDGQLLTWDIVDYIEALPYYLQTEDFVLVHSGVPIDENNYALSPEGIEPERLVYDRRFKDLDVLPKTEKCIFFGHTPTSYICGEPKILKYKKPLAARNCLKDYCKINLDVGTWINGVMGCLCVDTLEEFYVKK